MIDLNGMSTFLGVILWPEVREWRSLYVNMYIFCVFFSNRNGEKGSLHSGPPVLVGEELAVNEGFFLQTAGLTPQKPVLKTPSRRLIKLMNNY